MSTGTDAGKRRVVIQLTMNVVTVRLISESLTCRSAASWFNAGRYMVVDMGEKTALKEAVKTIAFFSHGLKIE